MQGSSRGDDFYIEWTTAWREAGMLAVFSQGNSGPRCNTTGTPGEFANTVGVAATDSEDSLPEFSRCVRRSARG